MKVLLINGSPNQKGCTNRALEEVKTTLNKEGVETELVWIGKQPIAGCIACRTCKKTNRCVFNNDLVKYFGLSILSALLSTIYDLIPKSIPTLLFDLGLASIFSSTRIDT